MCLCVPGFKFMCGIVSVYCVIVSVYLFVCVCLCASVGVYVCACTLCVSAYVLCVYVYIWMCMCPCVYVCACYSCLCVSVPLCVVCVCVCVCVWACVWVLSYNNSGGKLDFLLAMKKMKHNLWKQKTWEKHPRRLTLCNLEDLFWCFRGICCRCYLDIPVFPYHELKLHMICSYSLQFPTWFKTSSYNKKAPSFNL